VVGIELSKVVISRVVTQALMRTEVVFGRLVVVVVVEIVAVVVVVGIVVEVVVGTVVVVVAGRPEQLAVVGTVGEVVFVVEDDGFRFDRKNC